MLEFLIKEIVLNTKRIKINNFENIDLVIVNFYPFEETIKNSKIMKKLLKTLI